MEQLAAAVDRVDRRVDQLDARIGALGTRMDALGTRMDALGTRMDDGLKAVNARIDRLFLAMLGISGGVIATLVVQIVVSR